jgi:hypothetical protein
MLSNRLSTPEFYRHCDFSWTIHFFRWTRRPSGMQSTSSVFLFELAVAAFAAPGLFLAFFEGLPR